MSSIATNWTAIEIESLMSLPDSTQEQVLAALTPEERQSLHQAISSSGSERDSDAMRKRNDRRESARIYIPACVNPQRRERCLQDPQLFLKTYFPRDYFRPFGKLHDKLIDAIWQTASYGGKIAVAAPRGRGKTQVVMGMNAAVIFCGLVRFPLVIGPTTKHAKHLYEDFRTKVMGNELLLEDFPEVCYPVKCLEGAPQRAGRQHIDGKLTRIQWTAEGLRLPDVPLEYRGAIDYGGVRMEYRGLDAAICGINRDGDRPDFIPIDEPETRESAKSDNQIEDRENAIDKDINGLAGEDEELAQVMITTLRNRKCVSFRYTDPEIKPSWMGVRFGWVEKWPTEWANEDGLWQTYIAMRAQDQRAGDRYGRNATQFYLDNEVAMTAGGELLADNYKATVLSDGWVTVHSAWQVVFNAIADTSYDAFCTEYQNDPPLKDQIQTIALTHAHIASCTSGLKRHELPEWSEFVVRGIDMGKTDCWFVDLAFRSDGTGCVLDYGQFHPYGLTKNASNEAIEIALLNALTKFVDQCETPYVVDYALVDSGYKPDAIYEACMRIDGNYFPVQGPPSGYRQPKESDETRLFFQCHCNEKTDRNGQKFWLFHPNTEYWKNWLQERWINDPFIGEERVAGSMALFEPRHKQDIKFHMPFAKSMIAERLEHVPLPGKAYKSIWNVIDRSNNHWLDAAGYACAAASLLGVSLIDAPPEVKVIEAKEPETAPLTDQYGRPFVSMKRS